LPTKKKQYQHKQQTTPTHKIEAQATRNLQQFVDHQKLVHKSPNLPHRIEKLKVNWLVGHEQLFI
jgi:hypothetical protein